MNLLQIGFTASAFQLKSGYLHLIDGNDVRLHKRARLFDHRKHSFNPLPTSTDEDERYQQTCDFVDLIMAAFPAAGTTLTKEGVPEAFFEELSTKPKRLNQMFLETSKDPSYLSAQRMVRRILRSPILSRVFCKPTNFSLNGSIVLDRKGLHDFDAHILGWLLMAKCKQQIVVDNFGFYARPFHAPLIYQERLIAHVYELAELKEAKLLGTCMSMEKIGSGCTYDDAAELAKYRGLRPDPTREDNDYNNFLDEVMA